MIWSKVRALSQNDFEFEHIYTEDKATKRVIIFRPGASPELVSLASSAGLIKFIYPSPNLLQISMTKGFLKILGNIQNIKVGSFNKVNYCRHNCIITSYNGTLLPKHEKEDLERIEQRIIFNKVDVSPTTRQKLCQIMQGAHENHHCICCKETSIEENSYKSGPSTKDNSYFSEENTRELENWTQYMGMSTKKSHA
ncbi:hypothetical protein Hanom_Chr16g01437511 [Helianthus anomalus]